MSGGVKGVDLATALVNPTTPGFLQATRDFNQAVYIALDVCLALTALCGIISLAALGVNLARKDQRRLVQKTVKSEGTYILPHSPVLAPIMIFCYSIVGIAGALVLKAYLWKGTNLVVIQRLLLLLPMPVLLWAWLSAFSNAFAWHLTPMPESRALKLIRFKPTTLNWICWVTPLLIFVIQLVVTNEWPSKSAEARLAKHAFETLEKALLTGDPALEAARRYALHSSRIAESYYKGAWAIWAVSYGLCWVIYSTYSTLLLLLLGRQREFVESITTMPEEATKDEEAEISGKRPTVAERMSAMRRASSSTLKELRRSSQTSEMRSLSKRQLLRRNTKLIAIELFSYSVFTLCWCFLAIVKAALGYKILNNALTGPITVLGELYESSAFGTIAVSLLLIRGINILRNRAPDRQPEQSSPSDSRRQSLSDGLASRRGKTTLLIPLNVGDYIVVGASTPATPIYGDSTGSAVPATKVELPLASSFEKPSTIQKPHLSYFPTGDKVVPQIKRKTSVTFSNDLEAAQQTVVVPTLEAIAASPRLSGHENVWQPPHEWAYPLDRPQ